MRSTTAGELTTLAASARVVTPRIKVQNGSGTMVDYTSRFNAAKISHDIDQPVSGATVSFIRAQGATQSLSPLRSDSTLNVNDVAAYAPAFDLNRRITIEVATTAVGAAIVAGDYKMLFDGTIDIVNFEKNPVVLECRDKGAPLVDRWIETKLPYGSGPGVPIETVMQSIIDDVFGGGVHVLYVPVSPGFNVTTYQQQQMSVMDALQDLVQLIGWDVRYKWHDGTSAFRLTLSQPPRTKTVPDYTFGPATYIDIGQLGLELTNIRNVVKVDYPNGSGGRDSYTASDAPSIAKYGRRFFLIQEADTSPINTLSEATTMADAALSDLKDPKAEQGKNAPLFWPADISDLYRYSPNAVHYDSNQDWAVVGFDHEIAADHHRTNFKVRGGPAGAYNSWLGRGGTIGPTGSTRAPIATVEPLDVEADDLSWHLRFNAVPGSGGGGTNITWEIWVKVSYSADTLFQSGNGSVLPLDTFILRDARSDKLVRFVVTDSATGLTDTATFNVPSSTLFVNDTGLVPGDKLVLSSVPGTALQNQAVGTTQLANQAVGTTQIANSAVGPTQSQARNRVKLKHSAVRTVADGGGLTTLTWDTETYDVGGLHDGVNPTRITIPSGGDTGVWAFSVRVIFEETSATAGVGVRGVQIKKNGATVIADIAVPAVNWEFSASLFFPTIVHIFELENAPTVGDYYGVECFHNGGATLDIRITSSFTATHVW